MTIALAGNLAQRQASSSLETRNVLALARRRLSGHITIKYLIAALVVLVVADGLVSHYLINSGLASEGNPFLVDFVGQWNFLLIKLAGAFLSASMLWYIYNRRPRMALISTSCFVIVYFGIVFWNLGIFFMQ